MSDRIQVSPRRRDVAEALLIAAADLGYSPEVVGTTRNGYIVPADVAELYLKMAAGETAAIAEQPAADDEPVAGPDDTWKNAAIQAYAAEHDVDLGGATKKADMLAAIAAAGNKKE